MILQVTPGEPFGVALAFVIVAMVGALLWIALSRQSAIAMFAFMVSSSMVGLFLIDMIAYDLMMLAIMLSLGSVSLLLVWTWGGG